MKVFGMMKSLALVTTMSAMVISCNKSSGPTTKADLKTDEDKAFYSLGVMFGGRLKEVALSDKEVEMVLAGLRDTATGKSPVVNPTEYRAKIDGIFKERISKSVDKKKNDGKSFLETKVTKEGFKKTSSGLAYKVVDEGSGSKPNPTDTVEVHYKGTLTDGTVFDSSYARKKTINFPLNRVIPGWTEGLQLIKEKGKINLVIPSELAYGDRGAPPNVPGGATLMFEVELFKVSKGEAPKKGKK